MSSWQKSVSTKCLKRQESTPLGMSVRLSPGRVISLGLWLNQRLCLLIDSNFHGSLGGSCLEGESWSLGTYLWVALFFPWSFPVPDFLASPPLQGEKAIPPCIPITMMFCPSAWAKRPPNKPSESVNQIKNKSFFISHPFRQTSQRTQKGNKKGSIWGLFTLVTQGSGHFHPLGVNVFQFSLRLGSQPEPEALGGRALLSGLWLWRS